MLSEDARREIDTARAETSSTHRITVPALEAVLFHPFPVLDHGFVRVVDYMGDDSAVVQAARVSYGRGTKRQTEDEGLIRYLMRHRHSTPFEMCEIKLHIKLPIFIARQWIRHRTANVNEYSARYSILDREYYLPLPENLAAQSSLNRQGRDQVLSAEQGAQVLDLLKRDAEQCYETYAYLLNEEAGGDNPHDPDRDSLARELARMNLTLNYYTQWYWKIDLNNLMHFLSLRADAHAQWEIQAYSHVILDILAKWTPLTYQAFMEYRKGAVNLSRTGIDVVRRRLRGETVTREETGLSAREWRELMDVLGDPPPKKTP